MLSEVTPPIRKNQLRIKSPDSSITTLLGINSVRFPLSPVYLISTGLTELEPLPALNIPITRHPGPGWILRGNSLRGRVKRADGYIPKA